jgi:hypothetical protein
MAEPRFTVRVQLSITPEIADGYRKLTALTMSKSSEQMRRGLMFHLVDCGVLSLQDTSAREEQTRHPAMTQ